MTKILTLAGTCGDGPGSYEYGVFHLPDGSVRGVEELVEEPGEASSDDPIGNPAEDGACVPSVRPADPAMRRSGIARGLRDALAATGPLPRPFGFAAAFLDAGLDVLGGDGRSDPTVELRFADGASATIRIDAEGAAQIERDREVVRRAALRRTVTPASAPEAVVEAPLAEAGSAEASGPDARALASIFAYEKRGGRLRRLADKARDEVVGLGQEARSAVDDADMRGDDLPAVGKADPGLALAPDAARGAGARE